MLSCFSCDRKFLSHKTLREDRTAAVRKYVAEATSRRRRILRAGFFYLFIGKTAYGALLN